MVHLQPTDSMYIAEELSGLAKRFVEDGIVERQVDLLLIGFAHAVRNKLTPPEKIKRHDLLRAGALEEDARLAIESTATWYARECGNDEPSDAKMLLDLICRLGSVGVGELQNEWTGRSKSQIELGLLHLTTSA